MKGIHIFLFKNDSITAKRQAHRLDSRRSPVSAHSCVTVTSRRTKNTLLHTHGAVVFPTVSLAASLSASVPPPPLPVRNVFM